MCVCCVTLKREREREREREKEKERERERERERRRRITQESYHGSPNPATFSPNTPCEIIHYSFLANRNF